MLNIDFERIEWGCGSIEEYWIYFAPNWLPPGCRYLGYAQDWYDGPISSFGFWWFNICWRLPWTRHAGKFGLNIKSAAHRSYLAERKARLAERFAAPAEELSND